MQGANKTVVITGEPTAAFKRKLNLWNNKLQRQKIAQFPDLNLLLDNSEDISLTDVQDVIAEHLTNLRQEIEQYMLAKVDFDKHSWFKIHLLQISTKLEKEQQDFKNSYVICDFNNFGRS